MTSQEPENSDDFETGPWGGGSPEESDESPERGADRNLLLGLLAFQNGFIEHETLVDAVHAWIADKERPLGTILQAWGVVDEDQVDALTSLAIQHLKKHQGSGVQSLATIEATASLQKELGTIDDGAVATVLSRAMTEQTARDARRTGGRFEARPHYRYLKTSPIAHARGGLGEVYIADDLELRRKVALKEIRSQSAYDDQSRARFLLEGEVTGNLEHPGIVPVYGLGLYEDGRPYYAMRFIRGENLKETINEFREQRANHPGDRSHDLGFRKLLGRFIDVCNAIEYAHSRKVLHRDLKPANIMLGKFGETLVVDWGLAKLMDLKEEEGSEQETDPGVGPLHPSTSSAVEPTQMAQPIGTPQYMSPEQAACRVDLISPLSDVCGLGATLYYMLTGHSPHPDGDRDKVIQGKFLRPRELDPKIPKALEAICLKAMATNPEDRYPSALALAEDVDRWLGDQPVTAYRDPPTVRLARWSKRNRTMVSIGVTLLIASVIGLGINNVMVREERANTEVERQRAVDSVFIAGDILDRLMVGPVGDQLAQIPGTEAIRKRLVDEALGLANKTQGKWAGNPLVAVLSAPSLHLVANLDRSLDLFDRSFSSYTEALRYYDQAINAKLDEKRSRSAASRASIDYAEALRMWGRRAEALQQYDDATRRVDELKAAFPGDPIYEQVLARCYYNKADVFLSIGRHDEARKLFDRSIPLLEDVIQRYPLNNEQTRLILTYPLKGLGIVAREQGRLDQAGPAFERTLAHLDVLPPSNNVNFLRSEVLIERGRSLALEPKKLVEAEQSFDQSVEILKGLTADFPTFTPYRRQLAVARLERGLVRSDRGIADGGKSLEDATEARGTLEKLLQTNPRMPDAQGWLGEALGLLGRLETDREKRRELLKSAVEARKKAIEFNPDSPNHKRSLVHYRETLKALEQP